MLGTSSCQHGVASCSCLRSMQALDAFTCYPIQCLVVRLSLPEGVVCCP
jgi:hypothetical protein